MRRAIVRVPIIGTPPEAYQVSVFATSWFQF